MTSVDPSIFDRRNEELSFSGLFRSLQARIVMISALALVSGMIAWAMTWLVVPQYEATVVMMPVEDTSLLGGIDSMSPIGGLMSVAGLGLQGRSREREAIATIESRAFILSFIAEQQALPYIFPELWDDSSRKWKTKSGAPPSANAAYGRFKRKIMKVRKDSQKGIVEVMIRSPDRERTADWANALTRQLNDRLRTRAIDEAKRSLEFLDKEVNRTSLVPIREAIFKLVEAQTKEIMIANVRQEYAFQIIDAAVVPDQGSIVYPQRVLLALLGVLCGLFIGALIVVLQIKGAMHARVLQDVS